jgi:hypothetical protein
MYHNQERRNRVFVEIDERLRIAIIRIFFDAEIGVHYVRRVELSGKSVLIPKYLNQNRNNRVFDEIDERLRFAKCRAPFDAESGVRYVRRVEWTGRSV